MRHVFLAVLVGLTVGCSTKRSDTDEIVVLSAASMTDAVEALADSFEAAYPHWHVVHGVAATSVLARQIEQGVRADVFFSANREWIDHLIGQGRVAGKPVEFLTNRLVIVGPVGAKPLDSLTDLGALGRIALADPEHVPAGVYARSSLECAGLWDTLVDRVLPTLDVRAALMAIRSGAADAAIVYASDVHITESVNVLLVWPQHCAPEIRHVAALLCSTPNEEGAERFMAFSTDDVGAHFWRRFGFEPLVD